MGVLCWLPSARFTAMELYRSPDNKVHGVNMVPTWVMSAPDGPHVGPMNLAIRVDIAQILLELFTNYKYMPYLSLYENIFPPYYHFRIFTEYDPIYHLRVLESFSAIEQNNYSSGEKQSVQYKCNL